jgi:SsrA-binding protein
MSDQKSHIKIIAKNKKARFDYFIYDEYEAGISLKGSEVKALRMGKASLKDAYATIKNGEVFIYQMNISQYPFAYYSNHQPKRPRKLLLHKQEIKRLIGKTQEKGFTLIPINLYFKGSKVKLAIGLAKGKQKYDKRQTIRQRDEKRDMDRERKEWHR